MSAVAVVIVSYRSEVAAVAAARSVAFDPDVVSVTIVDNSASEQRHEVFPLDDLSERVVVVRPERNLGYAGGNNVGIRAAIISGHEYVLVLNPDVDLAPGTVRSLVEELVGSSAHVVSPALAETLSGREAVLRRPGFDLLVGRGVLEAPLGRRFTPTFFGAAFLARARSFEQFGLLDEQLFLYCEEIEFVERLGRQGERNVFRVAEDVIVRHGRGGTVSPGGYDAGARSTIAYEEASRSVVVFGKTYHPIRVWLWMLARLAMAGGLITRNPPAARAVVRGVVRGLRSRTVRPDGP
ncbi:glycosyltransferase [Curtobacterium sp. NPDC089991]|uniref:glycosyltransferase n=1 Tax=Curtobacterium sp. NPDC089991 TaxID=3363969 RepID=UPI0038191D35